MSVGLVIWNSAKYDVSVKNILKYFKNIFPFSKYNSHFGLYTFYWYSAFRIKFPQMSNM